MSALLWIPITAFCISAYAFVWGAVTPFLKNLWPVEGGFLATFWPITLPIALGVHASQLMLGEGDDG